MFKSTELLEYLDRQGFTLIYLKQLKFVLKKFQLFLDKNAIIDPSFQNFWDFLQTQRGSNKTCFRSIIIHVDRIFNMHWEDPRNNKPFTPLPLPEVEKVNKFFEHYSKDVLLPLDFLIIRVHQLLLEYGESKSNANKYLVILNRFRWFCFKNNENNFNHNLFEKYVEYENEVLKKEKHTFWLIRILFKVKKFIKLVVDFGSFTRDDLKTEPRIKKYSSDLELVRCNFKSYLVNKRKNTKAIIDYKDYILRQIFDCCNIQNLNQLKELNNISVNKILENFHSKCNKSTLSILIPVLKNILDYLYNEGLVSKKLSPSIFKSRYVKSYVPPYLTIESQAKLKETIKEASNRDKSIILLALELGLRKSDIINLRLSNLDFEKQMLKIVQHKTKKSLELPIFSHILETIKAYIKEERPIPYSDDQEIFLSTYPPFKPLSDLSGITSKWIKKAGIQAENKDIKGPHLMRYSLVHAMMSSESDKYLITQTLGHSIDSSDRPYLSMEEQMLKKCALSLELIGLGNGIEENENV